MVFTWTMCPCTSRQTLARGARRRSAAAETRRRLRPARLRRRRSTRRAGFATRAERSIAGLQARYASETGIRSLKIRHNNVLGYFVEVTAGQAPALEANGEAEKFIHRQTLASAMRFTTTELARARAENRQRRRPRAGDRAFDLRRPEPTGSRRRRTAIRECGARARGDRRGVGARRACRKRKLRAAEGGSEPRLRDRGRAPSGGGAGAAGRGAELCRERLRSGPFEAPPGSSPGPHLRMRQHRSPPVASGF